MKVQPLPNLDLWEPFCQALIAGVFANLAWQEAILEGIVGDYDATNARQSVFNLEAAISNSKPSGLVLVGLVHLYPRSPCSRR